MTKEGYEKEKNMTKEEFEKEINATMEEYESKIYNALCIYYHIKLGVEFSIDTVNNMISKTFFPFKKKKLLEAKDILIKIREYMYSDLEYMFMDKISLNELYVLLGFNIEDKDVPIYRGAVSGLCKYTKIKGLTPKDVISTYFDEEKYRKLLEENSSPLYEVWQKMNPDYDYEKAAKDLEERERTKNQELEEMFYNDIEEVNEDSHVLK